jgi:hypothetical protein
MRTTGDIDSPILRAVRAIRKREGRSMGAVMSELLAEALAQRRAPRPAFRWISRPMNARVNLADKDAVSTTLDVDRP